MQMLDQKKKKSKKEKKIFKLKKSQVCLFGSLLAIIGLTMLTSNHIRELKKEVFSRMQLLLLRGDETDEIIEDIPEVDEKETSTGDIEEEKQIDYSKYVGVLEIPKIRLKRGFYGMDSKYNDIEHNVTVVGGSSMPDVANGNLILAAHSGTAYISYFARLYQLSVGDEAYVTYGGVKYKYEIVNIYNVPKIGTITITRNMDRTTLTMITCTKDSETEQTVYIAELV